MILQNGKVDPGGDKGGVLCDIFLPGEKERRSLNPVSLQ